MDDKLDVNEFLDWINAKYIQENNWISEDEDEVELIEAALAELEIGNFTIDTTVEDEWEKIVNNLRMQILYEAAIPGEQLEFFFSRPRRRIYSR